MDQNVHGTSGSHPQDSDEHAVGSSERVTLPPILPHIAGNDAVVDDRTELQSPVLSASFRRNSTAQAASQDLLQRYISQLVYGCHRINCTNAFCASNPAFSLKTNEVATYAAVLAKAGNQHLCAPLLELEEKEIVKPDNYLSTADRANLKQVTAALIQSEAGMCQQKNDWTSLLQIIYYCFSEIGILNGGFRNEEGKLDLTQVDLLYEVITHKCPSSVASCLMTAIACLLDRLKLTFSTDQKITSQSLQTFALILFCPVLLDASFHSMVMTRLCDFIANSLTKDDQMELFKVLLDLKFDAAGRIHSGNNSSTISPLLFSLEPTDDWTNSYIAAPRSIRDQLKLAFKNVIGLFNQFITLRILANLEKVGSGYTPNSDDAVCNATKCLSICYDLNEKIKLLHFSEFYNDAVNDTLEIKDDFPQWKAKKGFSFCNFSFILNAAIKCDVLKVESMVQMRHELQDAFFRAMFIGVNSPYLVLEIRRDNIIRDALYQLENKKAQDLKKQLKIQFVGEEAVDEGGVQKEFFQLAVREIFDEKYAIFRKSEDSQLYWFTHQPDTDEQFMEELRLVGLLLGLAIYNGVILDLHFPGALYKKLMGKPLDLNDLMSLEPTLGKSLVTLLEYTGDVEADFSRTFQVDVQVYGELKTYELIPGGSSVSLNSSNRVEFVRRYVDFILNKSVEKAFDKFKEGFYSICGDTAITTFRPEELELLVCGGSDLDFEALKKATTYDGGYSLDSPVIRFFWNFVLQFNEDQKKRLLFFATGSDRVPIGGLAKLNFVIAKNGPDSNRLPSSHTCFNVLLLPEYSSAEKLQERLLAAIQNSEGFGMI
jgi:hypothetical protein